MKLARELLIVFVEVGKHMNHAELSCNNVNVSSAQLVYKLLIALVAVSERVNYMELSSCQRQ